MKKGFSICMIAVLLTLYALPVLGDAPKLASILAVNEVFERFTSYALDETSGDWSAHGLGAAKVLRAVEAGEAKGYMGNGVCMLYPSIRGNRELSLAELVLNVCLLKSSPIKAEALSIATRDARYDFVTKPESVKIGNYTCERFELPLGESGMGILKTLSKVGGEVRIYGEQKIFRTSIQPMEKYKNAKQRVEAMSMDAAGDLLQCWRDAGLGDYALWDLNEEYWKEERAQMAKIIFNSDAYDEALPALESRTQLLDTAKTTAVKAYHTLLKDSGFAAFKPQTTYGKQTRAATCEAQRYYGLLPTGQADRALIEFLAGTQKPKAVPGNEIQTALTVPESAEAQQRYPLGEVLSMKINRAWIARAASPSQMDHALSRIAPADQSNLLYIADGEVTNQSAHMMNLPLCVQASVTFEGQYTYPCQIQCERDQGQDFGGELLPMQNVRLLITAEIPENIARIAFTQIVLTIESGDGVQEFNQFPIQIH